MQGGQASQEPVAVLLVELSVLLAIEVAGWVPRTRSALRSAVRECGRHESRVGEVAGVEILPHDGSVGDVALTQEVENMQPPPAY